MRRALVLVDHGSRLPEAHAHLEGLAEQIRRRVPEMRVYVAHMEIASPSIEEAIDAAAREGATEVLVHPFFLVPGRHLTGDIPDLVGRAASRHRLLRVELTEPLGSAPGLADLIVELCLRGRAVE